MLTNSESTEDPLEDISTHADTLTKFSIPSVPLQIFFQGLHSALEAVLSVLPIVPIGQFPTASSSPASSAKFNRARHSR